MVDRSDETRINVLDFGEDLDPDARVLFIVSVILHHSEIGPKTICSRTPTFAVRLVAKTTYLRFRKCACFYIRLVYEHHNVVLNG